MILRTKFFLFMLLVSLCFLSVDSAMAVGLKGTVPEVGIKRLAQPPVIDGQLNDECWLEIAKSFSGVLTGWKNLFGTSLIKNQRIVYMGYDDDALYIGMICFVADTSLLKRGRNVFGGSADFLELYLENTYGEIFQLGVSCSNHWDMITNNEVFSFNSAAHIGENYWSVEIEIPWKGARIIPLEGTELGFNTTGFDHLDQWVTWGPSYNSFRRPETFCYLKLE